MNTLLPRFFPCIDSYETCIAALMLSIFVTACSDDVRTQYQDTRPLFGEGIARMNIEVDYQNNAAPYTQIDGSTATPWNLFQLNVEKLFSHNPRRIDIPARLDGMEDIGPAPLKDYTANELLELAANYRDMPSATDIPSFYILFINGYYAADGARQGNVLGLSIGDTNTVVMFKPVIKKSAPDIAGPADDLTRIFVEQMTLIHEFGHTIGLVDNGLPLTSAHHDEADGKHCTNRKCVMYYLNEGARDLLEFAKDLELCLAQARSPKEADDCRVAYGEECLNDAFSAADGPQAPNGD